MTKQILNNAEAAAYLGVSPGTLEVWRCTKRYAIPYIRIGRRIGYRIAALEKWLETRTVTPVEGLS